MICLDFDTTSSGPWSGLLVVKFSCGDSYRIPIIDGVSSLVALGRRLNLILSHTSPLSPWSCLRLYTEVQLWCLVQDSD